MEKFEETAAEQVRVARPAGGQVVAVADDERRAVVGGGTTTGQLDRAAGEQLVTALAAGRVQIGDNRGRINGWTGPDKVFGLCVEVDGVARPRIDGKTAET